MAVDEALARSRPADGAVLRLYRWRRPTLSVGRHQDPGRRYDPFALQALGVEIVRRPTGGREVLHDRELTYAVAFPFSGPGSLRGLYASVNEALLAALAALGVTEGGLARPAGRVPDPEAGACFAAPAPGEVVVAGAKLVGSAQVRLGGTLLQHGALLLDRPSVSLTSLARDGLSLADQGGTTLAALLGTARGALPSVEEVGATVEAALAGTFGGSWSREEGLTPDETALARSLAATYADPRHAWRTPR